MRVLVTGSSGFIGSYLVRALSDSGHDVVGIDRAEPTWSEPVRFIHADILEVDALVASLRGIECVFHLAGAKDDWGISRAEYVRDNVDATEKLLAVGSERGITKWFYYSTVGVLGRDTEPLDENAPLAPETDYGASKAEAEVVLKSFSRSHPGCEITVLRPSAVFGPRHPPTTNVHRLIEAVRSDRFIMVGDGDIPKTTSYIENLLQATLFLYDRMEPGLQIFNYVDEPVMTTDLLVERIYRFLDKERPAWRVPLGVAKRLAFVSDVFASALNVDFPITAARIEKFCTPTNFDASLIRSLGFRQPVGNEDALRKSVRWHGEPHS